MRLFAVLGAFRLIIIGIGVHFFMFISLLTIRSYEYELVRMHDDWV